ncbi:DUF6701 domain-containing protein [Vibrio lentus]|nr:DUF6701 domain-containing protein [Vibrio lentus]PMI58840.1 hypothetical protein BCU43_11890 [Vibrio lentus]
MISILIRFPSVIFFFLCVVALGVAPPSYAYDEIGIERFPNVVQGHANRGIQCSSSRNASQLFVYNDATIKGTKGLDLHFCRGFNYMPSTSCDDQYGGRRACSISYTQYPALQLKPFQKASGRDRISCTAPQNIYSQDLKFFTGFQGCHAAFMTSEHKIKSLVLYEASVIHFFDGEHWIEDLGMHDGSRIIIHGHVKIHLEKPAQLNGSQIEYADSNAQLTLVSRSSIELSHDASTHQQSKISGYVYAKSSVSLNNGSVISGRVNTQMLTLNDQSLIDDPDIQPARCEYLPKETFSSNNVDNWSIVGYKNSTKPHVENGRFRMNSLRNNQATAAVYNYLFPSDDNYVEVEFDHFAHSGSGADGLALVLSDASVPPQTGAFGGPLGYGLKTGIQGFAGGWLGLGIDEYGNYARAGGTDIGPGFTPNNVALRGSGRQDAAGHWVAGYRYIQGNHSLGNLDGRKNQTHRYKMMIDSRVSGKVFVTVKRIVEGVNLWQTVIPRFDVMQRYGQSAIPENFRISITASTGSLTNVHDLDNFQVCADKHQKITEGIHHFEFDYAGSGSTCQSSDIILRACLNESCSKLYPRDAYNNGFVPALSVNLLPAQGSDVANWEGGATVRFDNKVRLKLKGARGGKVKLGIAKSSMPQSGFDEARCRINGGPLSIANCEVTFSSHVLAVEVKDIVASKQSSGDNYLSFCSQNTSQEGLSRDVNMSIEYEVAPVERSKPVSFIYQKKRKSGELFWSQPFELNTSNAKLTDVYFDNKGSAAFKIRYAEVGKIKLKARVADIDDSAGFKSFVSFPAGLRLSAYNHTGTKGDCSDTTEGCARGFVAAGEVFETTVVAYQHDNSVARNYQESDLLMANHILYPVQGVDGQLLNTTLPEGAAWKEGEVKVPQALSEVGAFELTVQAPIARQFGGGDIGKSVYLGSQAFKIEDGRLAIGRFYPKYFLQENPEWHVANQNDIAYLGQTYDSTVHQVYPMASGESGVGNALNNYRFFRSDLQAKFGVLGDSAIDNRLLLDTEAGSWSTDRKHWLLNDNAAVLERVTETGGVSRKDTPFNTSDANSTVTHFGLTVEGTDPVSFTDSDTLANSVEFPVQPPARYGRMALDDIGGNSGSTLTIPLRAEFWDGRAFVVNEDDERSIFNGSKACQQVIWHSDSATTTLASLNGSGSVDDGEAEVTANQNTPAGSDVPREQVRLWLRMGGSKPNKKMSENDISCSTDYEEQPWLQYNWRQLGDEDPSTVVTFGIYRGNDRVIYRGESGLTGQ